MVWLIVNVDGRVVMTVDLSLITAMTVAPDHKSLAGPGKTARRTA
jgi:hypothetical protein